jgi:DNA-directed RNA polymerase specialized sigma24 family protein
MSTQQLALFTLHARSDGAEPDDLRVSDLWLYREKTTRLLHRFLRLSLETGRVPSLLGREIFRSKISHKRAYTFEDAVIFVHDVERCLDLLDDFSRQLIARITLQEYTQEEAADILHCCRRTVIRLYPEALDRLSEIFLAAGILLPLVSVKKNLSSPQQAASVQ